MTEEELNRMTKDMDKYIKRKYIGDSLYVKVIPYSGPGSLGSDDHIQGDYKLDIETKNGEVVIALIPWTQEDSDWYEPEEEEDE